MSRLPLSTFLPIKTPKAVADLVKYLSAIKPRERYRSKDCLDNIASDALKLQFCNEVVEQDIFQVSDPLIAHYINPSKPKNATKKAGDNTGAKQKKKESRTTVPKKQKVPKVQQPKPEVQRTEATIQPPSACSKAKHIIIENIIIAKNVPASSFSVENGCIHYLNYCLKSKRISAIPSSVLAKIERNFTIRKDGQLSREPKAMSRFIFEPATDLSVFLNEARKASCKLGRYTAYIDKPVEGYGIFDLPWKYVLFREGYMYLIHPDAKGKDTINPFRYSHYSIHKTYSNFLPYIERYATKLRVEGHDGRITRLLNFEDFAKIFPHLTSYASMDDHELFIDKMRKNVNRAYTIEEFRKAHFAEKSKYLAYLQTIQHTDFKIYYLLENVVHESSELAHDEFGYLFTISDSPLSLTLLYENISDESRSSLIFNIRRSVYESAVTFIARFLASDEVNKRLKIARGQVRFNFYIKSYDRISHTSYFEWRSRVNFLSR